MAVIKFSPTTIYVWDGSEFHHEGEPLMTGESPNLSYFTAMWFDIDEVIKVINASTQDVDANFYMYITQPGTLTLSMHKERLPDQQNRPFYYTAGIDWIDADTGNLTINVNNLGGSVAIEVLGRLGRVTLLEALNAGFQGFVAYSGVGYPVLQAVDLELQIEGEWDNQTPTLRSPVGGAIQDINAPITFQWTHNGALEQESFELRYRIKGTSTWTTVTETTNRQTYTLPANSLTVDEYEWQVRTVSEYGFESNWSSIGIFKVAETTPAPIIIKPTENEIIGISTLHVEWISPTQYQYEIQLLDANNNVIWSDSRISTNTNVTVENILENNTAYKVRLRVNEQGGLFSPWVEVSFTVSYTPPAKPVLTITPNEEISALEIDIYNPPPQGTEPTPVSQELFRREQGGQWIKLANLVPNSSYTDYAVASEKKYEYRVTVLADNDTTSTSDIFVGSLKIKDAILSSANNSVEFVRLVLNPERSFNFDFNATLKHFAGRSKPVTEFGEQIENNFSLSYLVEKDDLDTLLNLARKQETLLYRDSRGRKYFSTIASMSVDDDIRFPKYYSVQLSLTEVDYREGID